PAMRLASVTVTYGRTLAIPRHGQAHLEVTLTAKAEPGDDLRTPEELRAALDALWHEARASVREQGQALLSPPAPSNG
ncbi:MAG: hypothetical protein HGA45_34055, partial [Chloroflexales bacterium]|nr:hypothetical protein [Chloroflexales bacterium]